MSQRSRGHVYDGSGDQKGQGQTTYNDVFFSHDGPGRLTVQQFPVGETVQPHRLQGEVAEALGGPSLLGGEKDTI